LYGSRIKGNFSKNSDLDIAIQIESRPLDTDFDVYTCEGNRWQSDLENLIPYKVDLQRYADKNSQVETIEVKKGVAEKSILVYKKYEISKHLSSNLTESQALAIITLIDSVWPQRDKTVAEMVKDLLATSAELSSPDSDSERIVVWEEGQAIALSHTFTREIFAPEGSIKTMALADVCVDPTRRGEGFGAQVARRAFGRVDSGVSPVSLFQTEVPDFYVKLGAKVIGNRFVNSKNDDDPRANPWWDPHVMIYPADYSWPAGQIDLNGAGY